VEFTSQMLPTNIKNVCLKFLVILIFQNTQNFTLISNPLKLLKINTYTVSVSNLFLLYTDVSGFEPETRELAGAVRNQRRKKIPLFMDPE
jgi:hypothetical protein